MSWYASDELDEAWEEAREVLLPFDLGNWTRLLVIVIFTGHGFSMPNIPSSLPADSDSSGSFEQTYGKATGDPVRKVASNTPEFPMTGLATAAPTAGSVLGSIVFLIAVLFLGFFYLSSVFEFIYYQSLLDKKVSIRDNFKLHAKRGARYFGFRLVVIALMLVAVIGSFAGLVANPLAGGLILFAVILALLPVMVFMGLTQNFVLLGMMENRTGLIQAWRDFYPKLKSQWKQVGVYLLIRFGIKIGVGVAALIWALLSFLVLLIPFGILAALLYMVAPVLATVPAILGVITWLILILGLQVVFQTYLYYYAILVYHELTS